MVASICGDVFRGERLLKMRQKKRKTSHEEIWVEVIARCLVPEEPGKATLGEHLSTALCYRCRYA